MGPIIILTERRIILVHRLAISFATHRQIFCYFLIRTISWLSNMILDKERNMCFKSWRFTFYFTGSVFMTVTSYLIRHNFSNELLFSLLPKLWRRSSASQIIIWKLPLLYWGEVCTLYFVQSNPNSTTKIKQTNQLIKRGEFLSSMRMYINSSSIV